MNIVALVGSIRQDSYNLGLIKTMQDRYRDKMDMTIANIEDLPYFHQDKEENPDEVVQNFKKQIANCDAVIIATPEYNWSVPGVLKNALDWLSRVDKPMQKKPAMIVGVSIGQIGTLRAQQHLRQILSSPGLQARVLPPAGNEFLLNHAAQKFQDGRLVDEPTLSFLDEVTERFIAWVNVTRK